MVSNILVYSSLFPSETEPVKGLFVAELVKSLAARIQVSVVKPVLVHSSFKEIWKGARKYYFLDDVQVRAPLCFNIPKMFKFTDGYLMAKCSRQAFEESVNEKTDLVHAHFAYPDAVAAGILALERDFPLVVTVHGSDINILAQDPKRQSRILKMMTNANAIICVSRDLVAKVVQLGVPEENVYHIPNGVDTMKFCPGNKKKEKKRIGLAHIKKLILTVGNLIPVKGYDNLIKALPDVDSDIGLVMVGFGHERNKLEKLVKNLGLEKRVFFAGMVNHEDLVSYYRASDFLVISSHSEGWPTVIFEALACGVPVIANGVGGIPEVLSSTELGIIMRDNHHRTIAQTISSAYERDWNSLTAVSVARQNSWEEIGLQTLEIYEKVLS